MAGEFVAKNGLHIGPDGSSGTPVLAWQEDTNTGFYRAVDGGADDLIGIVTGGTDRLLISATDGFVVKDVAKAEIDVSGSSHFKIDGTSSGDLQLTLSADNNGSGNGIVGIAATSTGGSGTILLTADTKVDATADEIELSAGGGGSQILLDSTGYISAATTDGDVTVDAGNATASTNVVNTISATNTGATAGDATVLLHASSTNGTPVVGVKIDAASTVGFYADRNESTEPWHLGSGSISEPSYSFGTATTTGMFYTTVSGAHACAFAAGGADAAQILGRGILLEAEGAAATPAYSFSDYATTGLYWGMFASAEGVGVTTGGTERLYVSSGVMAVQNVGSIDMDSSGGVSIDAGTDINLVYDTSEGGNGFFIKYGSTPTTIVDMTAGKFAVTTLTDENASINNTGDAWTEVNGVFWVPAGDGLQVLLEYLINTATDSATIMLAEGTYDLSWTTAFTINRSIHIIGISPDYTTINFRANDTDNYFSFAARCHFDNVKFTASGWGGSAPDYLFALTGAADGSVFENCEFDTIPADRGIFSLASGCDNVVISHNLFSSTPTAASTRVVSATGADRVRFIDNDLPDCDCEYLVYVGDGTTTTDVLVRGNRVVAGAQSNGTAKLYFGSACSRGIIEGNYLDYSSSAADTFISLGGSGSGAGNVGNARFVNNYLRCERATSSSWSSGVDMMEVTTPRSVISANVFYLRYIGYTNTQQGNVLSINNNGYDTLVEGNNLVCWDCRTAIEIYCGAANSPSRVRILDNEISDLDHDGTGNGYGVYFNIAGAYHGSEGCIIANNTITATSSAEHTSIDSSDGSGTYFIDHAVIMGNVQDNITTIQVGKFRYSSILGNTNMATASTAGSSVSGTNSNNVYGYGNGTTPGTQAPGANQ